LKFTWGTAIIDTHLFPKFDVGRSPNSENYWLHWLQKCFPHKKHGPRKWVESPSPRSRHRIKSKSEIGS